MSDGPILVTGATGLLGGMLLWQWRELPFGTAAVVRRPADLPSGAWPKTRVVEAELTRPQELTRAVREAAPRAVVHCAALTNVDYCQRHPQEARSVNALASGQLARAAREAGAGFIYISTDAGYADGPGPHSEESAGGRMSVYARSKLAGEEEVLAGHPDALVLRTCLFGWNQDPGRAGLAEWIIDNLRQGCPVTGFQDVFFSPLFTGTLARVILLAHEGGLTGVYNAGSADGLSKYEFARRMAGVFGLDEGLVGRGSLAEVDLAAPRPASPVLDSSRLARDLNWTPPPVDREIQALAAMETTGEIIMFRRFGGFR